MLIGIAGATGYQGSWTVCKLHERGDKVRALVRRTSDISAIEPWCEVTVVDFDSQSCIRDALQGVEVLILCLSRRRGSETTHEELMHLRFRLVHAAREAHVKIIARISSQVPEQDLHLSEVFSQQKAVDDLLRSQKDMRYILLHVTSFCKDLDVLLETIDKKNICIIPGPGTYRLHPIHRDDLANYLIDAIERAQAGNIEVNIGGPVDVCLKEMAQICFQELKRPVRIYHLPMWLLKLGLIAAGLMSFIPRFRLIHSTLGLVYFGFAGNHLGEHVGKHNPHMYIREAVNQFA
ncbi:MAG: SDR family oxidoreductase [Prochloraceae cyanobacterium]